MQRARRHGIRISQRRLFVISLWFLFFSIDAPLPAARVEVEVDEVDAVWVPPGTTGPIVAMPGPAGVFR